MASDLYIHIYFETDKKSYVHNFQILLNSFYMSPAWKFSEHFFFMDCFYNRLYIHKED